MQIDRPTVPVIFPRDVIYCRAFRPPLKHRTPNARVFDGADVLGFWYLKFECIQISNTRIQERPLKYPRCGRYRRGIA